MRTLRARRTRATSPKTPQPSTAHPRVVCLREPREERCASAAASLGKTSRPGTRPYSSAPVVEHTLFATRRGANRVSEAIGRTRVAEEGRSIARGGKHAGRSRMARGRPAVGEAGHAPHDVRIDAPRGAEHEVELASVGLHHRDAAAVTHRGRRSAHRAPPRPSRCGSRRQHPRVAGPNEAGAEEDGITRVCAADDEHHWAHSIRISRTDQRRAAPVSGAPSPAWRLRRPLRGAWARRSRVRWARPRGARARSRAAPPHETPPRRVAPRSRAVPTRPTAQLCPSAPTVR